MPFYYSLKSLPELRGRTWKERRQAMSQVGLAPYRRLQVWGALALASLALLWTLDTVLGNLLWNGAAQASDTAATAWVAGPLCVALIAALVFRHSYLKALRPALAQVAFDPAAGWWRSAGKGVLKGLAAIPLALAGMALLDVIINSFDESPSPRLAEVRRWPQAIAPEGNGFIAAIGLLAAPGTSPFEAGRAWIAAADSAAASRPLEYPKAPADLPFVPYDAVPGAPSRGRGESRPQFCRPGKESCLSVVHADATQVQAWLAANPELLARYQSLYQYPGWQYTTSPGLLVIPPYLPLMRAQSLLHATALQAVERNNTGYAIELLGRDMHFARNMLAGQSPLVGKMVAAALLANDLAIVTELLRDKPGALAPYWHDLDLMLEPLEAGMVSAADTMRFEERYFLAELDSGNVEPGAGDAYGDAGTSAWSRHHFQPMATANLVIRRMDRLIARVAVSDAAFTPLISGDDAPDAQDFSRLTGFMRNQGGKWLLLVSGPEFPTYINRLAELNALNNFVHLRVALAKNAVPLQEIPAYLEHSPSGLRNPETGKPFGWDPERRQITFTPGTRSFMTQFPRDAGGKIVLAVPGA